MFRQIFQQFLRRFFQTMGREPQTPAEWMRIQDDAVRHLNRTKGAPSIKKEPTLQDVLEGKKIEDAQGKTWDFGKFEWRPEDAPLKGGKPELVKEKITIDEVLQGPVESGGPKGPRSWDLSQKKGEVIPFPNKGIRGLMEKGDITVGKAPKTLPETLQRKKAVLEGQINKEKWIARKKQENKDAIRRFKEKNPRTVEDFRDKDDWDPYGMAYGGIAPLVGEPSYAADFYDDRTPMEGGGTSLPRFNHPDKRQGILGSGVTWTELMEDLHPFMYSPGMIERAKRNLIDPVFKKKIKWDELDDYYKQLEMDKDMRNPENVPLRGDQRYAAQGGRIGLFGGGKAANWFIKNFKSLIDEAANPGPWSRFSKMGAKDKQAAIADAKEMIKNLEAGDPIPEYLLEDIVANPKFKLKRSKAKDPDLAEVENLVEGYNKLKNARANKFRGEIKLSPNDPSGAYSRNASSALDDYELFTPTTTDMFGKPWKGTKDWTKKERTQIKKTQKEIGPAPSSRHPEYRSMVQIRKGLEDRLTALDITEELGGNIKMYDKLRMHNYPTYKNTLDKRDWLMPPGGLKRREAFVIDLGHHTLPPKKAEGGIIGFNSGGPVDQEALIQMYLEEGLSYDEAVAAAQATSGLDMDISKKAEGGRAGFIFGGSAGLRALLKKLKGGRKRVFPSPPQGIKKFMSQADTDYINDLKLQQLEAILRAAKIEKETLAHSFKVKKMNDPGLDFLMGRLQESALKAKNLDKYTNIDKDIMDIEMMIKNYTQKKLKRKPHHLGGRVSYSGGGRAGLPAVTMGTPQMNMQGPQMPVSAPQPTGIPGANLQQNQMDLMQQKMQQNPWMPNQMQQGMGGMQNPQYKGQLRMPFGKGGMGRRAFMKMMAGLAALPFVGKGITKVAPKVFKEAEVITRGADGMPTYLTDLIEVVKAKGTRDIIEGFKKSDYSTVHSYKGVDVIEDPLGNIKIKKPTEGVATDASTGKMHEGTSKEIEMEIRPGKVDVIDEGTGAQRSFQTTDEYFEGTVRPDRDGKMKDFEEFIDESDHLELKKIADEINEEVIIKKASGGVAHLLGE